MSVLAGALADLKKEKVMAEIMAMKDAGTPPLTIVDALQQGMREIGERFEAKEYYLSELIMSALIFKEAIQDATGRPFPDDPQEQLWGAIGAVFDSWNGARAVEYRRIHHIKKLIVDGRLDNELRWTEPEPA